MPNTLVRELKYGEQLSFDGGRIVVRVEERAGKRVGLCVKMSEDVLVDKPRRLHQRADIIARAITRNKAHSGAQALAHTAKNV